jgi:hypothetical protein
VYGPVVFHLGLGGSAGLGCDGLLESRHIGDSLFIDSRNLALKCRWFRELDSL